MNKRRIFTSMLTILVAAAVVVGATMAWFSDRETSQGNRFQAGALDLRVDSEAHYNGLVCREDTESTTGYSWLEPVGSDNPDLMLLEHYGQECAGTWPENNLVAHRFFNFEDLKPGDFGENTISLHVYNNDAWGRFRVHGLETADNTCTEPEGEAEEGSCNPLGDLQDKLVFSAWLDQGSIPGFQNVIPDPANPGQYITLQPEDAGYDPEEGNNIWDGEESEPRFWNNLAPAEGTWNLADVLGPAYATFCTGEASPSPAANGNNNYGFCHGLAADGRMVGSTTYYFGLAWSLPTTVGNEVQTDSLTADMSFDVVQWRNNPAPNPSFPPLP